MGFKDATNIVTIANVFTTLITQSGPLKINDSCSAKTLYPEHYIPKPHARRSLAGMEVRESLLAL